jgi:1-acyl-sn-glycerol-3-phosphate acyltransferase
LLPIHTSVFHPVPVTLAVGEPIETSGYTMRQIDDLTMKIKDEICRLFYEHSYLEPPAHPELEAVTQEGHE